MITKELPSWHPLAARVQDMTLRDYFAAKAMQGDLIGGVHPNDFEEIAKRAYQMSDAMMKAKES